MLLVRSHESVAGVAWGTPSSGNQAESPAPIRAELVNHQSYLLALARSIVGNKSDAEDLVQDTCRRALEHEHQFAADTNLRGWLTSILRNAHRDRLRRGSLEILSPSVGEDLDMGANIPASSLADLPLWRRVPDQALAVAVRHMPPVYRQVYTLREDGCVYGDIARKLNISVNTVAIRMHRARHWLRRRLTAGLTRDDGGVLGGPP